MSLVPVLKKGAISKHNNNLYTCWPSKSCSCPSQGAYASAGALILSNRITSYEGDDNHPPEKWATMNWGTWDFWEWDFEVSVNELHRKKQKKHMKPCSSTKIPCHRWVFFQTGPLKNRFPSEVWAVKLSSSRLTPIWQWATAKGIAV